MAPQLIVPFSDIYTAYLRDESRTVGQAESISFPRSEEDVRSVLQTLHTSGTPVTVQGARTGLAAAAVPNGGHIMNLSGMDRVLSLREDSGRFYLTAQPGVLLLNLRIKLSTLNTAYN